MGPAHNNKYWAQMDLRSCQNKESKRSENNEKGGQQDRKSRRNMEQNGYKL